MAVGAVATAAIIVDFNIFEKGSSHLAPSYETFAMDHFYLQCVEKAFGAGVIVAVALGAHAANQFVL